MPKKIKDDKVKEPKQRSGPIRGQLTEDLEIDYDKNDPLDRASVKNKKTGFIYKESPKAYKVFLAYIEWRTNNPTGEYKSMRQFASEYKAVSYPMICEWSRVWHWLDRAARHERIQQDALAESLKNRKVKTYRNQLIAADKLLAKALRILDNVDESKANIKELLDLASQAIHIQRQVFGEPTEIIAQEIGTRHGEPIQFSIADLMSSVSIEGTTSDDSNGGIEE